MNDNTIVSHLLPEHVKLSISLPPSIHRSRIGRRKGNKRLDGVLNFSPSRFSQRFEPARGR